MATSETALTIRRIFQRPQEELLQRFRTIPTGNLCDARGRTGALDYRLKPVTLSTRFCGPALTVDAGPQDNLAAWAALELVRPGDVILISTGAYLDCSVIGDIYVGMAKNAGAAAIVTDGLVRDVPGIDAVGIPVFARGVSPNSPWKNGPGRVGLPIVIGGVSVGAGDVVAGDQDGVVVLELLKALDVADELQAVLAKEIKMEESVKAGTPVPGWLAEACRSKGVRYVD